MSKFRFAAVGVTLLLLAACGPVHPGAAATIAGTRISMSEVDDLADTYCAVSSVQSQGQGGAVDRVEVRRQAVADLTAGEVADQIAADRNYDITVPPLSASDLAQIKQLFGARSDAVVDLVDRNQRTTAIVLEMAKDAGNQSQDQDTLLQAGSEELSKAIAAADVSIDPRFGLDDSGQQIATTGSLSIPSTVLDATASEDRPAALKCS